MRDYNIIIIFFILLKVLELSKLVYKKFLVFLKIVAFAFSLILSMYRESDSMIVRYFDAEFFR